MEKIYELLIISDKKEMYNKLESINEIISTLRDHPLTKDTINRELLNYTLDKAKYLLLRDNDISTITDKDLKRVYNLTIEISKNLAYFVSNAFSIIEAELNKRKI